MTAPRNGSDLEMLEERVMLAIPRGDGREEMRVVFARARTPEGREVAWHSVGLYWRTDDGQWRRGKNVATIRSRELHAVADALAIAANGGAPRIPPASAPVAYPPSAPPQRPTGARPPEHRQSSAGQLALQRALEIKMPPQAEVDDDKIF